MIAASAKRATRPSKQAAASRIAAREDDAQSTYRKSPGFTAQTSAERVLTEARHRREDEIDALEGGGQIRRGSLRWECRRIDDHE